jgi:hypothetical protein
MLLIVGQIFGKPMTAIQDEVGALARFEQGGACLRFECA